MSAIAGVTIWSFNFPQFTGTIKAPQAVEFLEHLLRHVRGQLLVIWDGLPAHRRRLVKDYDRAHEDRLVIERLPESTPELEPVEYLWGY